MSKRSFYTLVALLLQVAFLIGCMSLFPLLLVEHRTMHLSKTWIAIHTVCVIVFTLCVYCDKMWMLVAFGFFLVISVGLQVTSIIFTPYFFDQKQAKQEALRAIGSWDGSQQNSSRELNIFFELQRQNDCCGVNGCDDYHKDMPVSCCEAKQKEDKDSEQQCITYNCHKNCSQAIEDNEELAKYFWWINMGSPLVFQILLIRVIIKLYKKTRHKKLIVDDNETLDETVSSPPDLHPSRSASMRHVKWRDNIPADEVIPVDLQQTTTTTSRGTKFGYSPRPLDDLAMRSAIQLAVQSALDSETPIPPASGTKAGRTIPGMGYLPSILKWKSNPPQQPDTQNVKGQVDPQTNARSPGLTKKSSQVLLDQAIDLAIKRSMSQLNNSGKKNATTENTLKQKPSVFKVSKKDNYRMQPHPQYSSRGKYWS